MKLKDLVEKRLKKYSANQLISKLEKGNLTKLEKEVCIEILKKRDQDVSKWEQKSEESLERENLIDEVDKFVDKLIEDKRDGVYTEVMKALGGKFESDIEDLFQSATEEQLEEALSFKKIKGTKKKSIKKVEEVKVVLEGEKEVTVITDITPKSTKKEPTKNKSKSIQLEESKEIKGLVTGVTVEFKTAGNSKFPNKIISGKIKKIEVCSKSSKEYCKIISDKGIFYKRSNSLKLK